MYLLNVGIAFDQLVNAVLGGMPDETISAKLWRKREHYPFKIYVVVVDCLFWFDKDHCRTSYEAEINKKHLPQEYKD